MDKLIKKRFAIMRKKMVACLNAEEKILLKADYPRDIELHDLRRRVKA